MKKIKLLIVTILLGFLTFGMSYNNLLKENVVAQLVKQIAKVEEKLVAKVTNSKTKPSPVKKESSVNSIAVAATVSVANSVAINGGGNAQPGSQLDFTITINNTGTDATGTTFQDILDANLTLVPNSLKVTPIAVNDAYNCIGNVGITLNAAEGVLANDVSPDETAMTVAILANGAHGTATLSTDGSFTYNPTVGYSGNDSFTYTLTNASGKTDTATVNITISTPIYFVNSSAATNGNGTLSSPFKLVQNAIGTGSNPVFIYTGTGSSGTTLTLSTNQKVIGQGATASLVSLLGLTVPSYSNVLPTTGGNSPTFSTIALSSNNDIQGVILSSTMTGSSVGNLKVRDVTITGGNTYAVNFNNGALDCIFKSISSNGGAGGLLITNTTGSFQVTGTGTTAGSGGTIQNVSDKGAHFNSCTNISLKNMNFVSSNNAAISLVGSSVITLDNISVTGTNSNFGIVINNVTNFALNNSTLTGCGSNLASSNVGGIYAENLKGTSTITNTNVNDSWGRGFYTYNNQGTSNLTITSCQFKNSFDKANGGSNFIFEGYGTSNNTLVLKGNDFSNSKEYGLTLNFGGTSTNNIQVGGNTSPVGNIINAAVSSPGSNGLSLQSNGSAVVNYNIINNTIKSSFNGSFTCNVGSQDNAIMNGRINSNTIDGGGIGSVSNGIAVAAYGNAKHITEILNNTITNANNYGIVSEANDNNIITANARMDATIKNNNISLVSDSYAHVSVISIGTLTSTLISAANIGGNITNSPVTNLVATFDVLALGSISNKIILQGITPYLNGTGDRSAALTTFWNANNSTGSGTAIDEQGGGTIESGIVLVPSNASASKIAAPKNVEEQTTPIAEIQNIALLKTNQSAKNSSANATAETISVGPFTLPAGKTTIITFSATINAANVLPANTCAVTNMASVSGTNFATVNSNITTTSIKPENATFTNTTENIPCLGSTPVTLNATCPLGTKATWYTTLTGGNSFDTGTSVTAIPTTDNTTYCVACETAYCASDRLLVKTVTGTPSTTSPAETVTACDTYTWAVNSATYTISGTYTAVVGCDTKTLNLTITNSTASSQTVAACDTYTWSENNATYTASGVYTKVVGCDTKTLNLTITNSTASSQTVTACDTYTWSENNATYTTSGVYTNVVGCDTKTLNLTITNSSASSQTVTACDTYTWSENNATYTTSGVYTNVVGCDTKTLNLTITNSSASSQTITACDTYTWPENNATYTTSGVYTKIVGCDTKTLNLTITNSLAINTIVSLNSGVLTSNQLGANYQWYKCPNTLLVDETNQSYTPLTVGDYKVEITEGNCTVTSNCITVSSLSVGEFKENEFKIYPNPSKGIIKITTPYEGNYLIIDQSGKTIKSVNLEENVVNTLNLENAPEGIYYIISTSDYKMKAQKFIIKK